MLRPEDGRLSYIYIPIYRCIGPSGRSRRLVAYVRIFRYSCPRLYDWGTILWFRWIKLFLLVQGSRMFLGMFFISSLCYTRYMTFPVFPVWRVFSDDLIGLCFFFFSFFPANLILAIVCLYWHRSKACPPFPVILVVWRLSTLPSNFGDPSPFSRVD